MTSMDRLARSLSDLYSIVDDLTARGVSVKFLKEGQTYSKDSMPVAKLMLGLLGSVAEFERSIIRERQAEGIAQAKKRGAYKGRAKVLTAEQVAQAKKWIDEGIPKTKVANGSVLDARLCIATFNTIEALLSRAGNAETCSELISARTLGDPLLNKSAK